MNKKQAKKQFNRLTKKLDIEHTFTFEEAWEFLEYKRSLDVMKKPDFKILPEYSKKEFRDKIVKTEDRLMNTIR